MVLNKDTGIYIAGHRGLIGSAFVRRLEADKYNNIIIATREALELTDFNAVEKFFSMNKPEVVILAAGKVGGIVDNIKHPVEFIQDNLSIQLNIFKSAQKHKVKKLLFFASSCMYPVDSEQPMKESQICTGLPESTSIAYATSKYTGVQMCQAINRQNECTSFIPVIPNSVYGPNDNFDLNSSHVLSALIRRFHEGKCNNLPEVTLWGTGLPRREFVYVDDVVNACLLLMNAKLSVDDFPINIGVGYDISIKDLAEKVKNIIGYTGVINWDLSKPDGVAKKLLENSKIIKTGWKETMNLDSGIRATYKWYLENIEIP
jgi:GDP-L-fucose synthase